MDKEVIETLKIYLEQCGIYSANTDENEIDRRCNGKKYGLNDHVRAMVYSMLSNQKVWSTVVPKLPQIDLLFFNYDVDKIKEKPGKYFSDGIFSLSCGNRSTAAQMKVLHDNIAVFEKIIKEYDSLDGFVTSAPAYKIVDLISSYNSPYKLKQLGIPLAWEYLRNVGIDGAKPDTHLKRFMGVGRMGVSRSNEATEKEVYDEVERLASETGYRKLVIDYLIWLYCADGYGEICTASPHCDRCVIKQYCNRLIETSPKVTPTIQKESALPLWRKATPQKKNGTAYNKLKMLKKDIRAGLIAYMATKDPGKSESTYKMYVSDSNYLINNGAEDEYIRFMRSDNDMPEIKELIKNILIEHRGSEKVTDGGLYYYEKLSWQREYVKSLGGIDSLLRGY